MCYAVTSGRGGSTFIFLAGRRRQWAQPSWIWTAHRSGLWPRQSFPLSLLPPPCFAVSLFFPASSLSALAFRLSPLSLSLSNLASSYRFAPFSSSIFLLALVSLRLFPPSPFPLLLFCSSPFLDPAWTGRRSSVIPDVSSGLVLWKGTD